MTGLVVRCKEACWGCTLIDSTNRRMDMYLTTAKTAQLKEPDGGKANIQAESLDLPKKTAQHKRVAALDAKRINLWQHRASSMPILFAVIFSSLRTWTEKKANHQAESLGLSPKTVQYKEKGPGNRFPSGTCHFPHVGWANPWSDEQLPKRIESSSGPEECRQSGLFCCHGCRSYTTCQAGYSSLYKKGGTKAP